MFRKDIHSKLNIPPELKGEFPEPMEPDDNGDLTSTKKKKDLKLHSINAFEKLGDQNEHDTSNISNKDL